MYREFHIILKFQGHAKSGHVNMYNDMSLFLRTLDWPGRTTLQQDPSAHVYWESLIVEAKDPEPRTGAAYIGLGEACLTSDWLTCLGKRTFTAYVCVVASSSQLPLCNCHSATASHTLLSL